ncbi:kinetochore-associated protein DSN1 homolog [Acanthaster planci]|uniref:Kinetochore-associated protein DSN1 homolog n=1 Tax=Acanthaster planci TaxID=133434 RepID=A0A8B7ZRA8_ACAPL|nr:kinetochore-associated protein DSN1 homolog [Acanthaster planci]XP_022107930.1 kinetochore-associated protein DSN1 homolog [Acanthaster planci]XP_022107931.1 kinetochore-associated protein DSN1 homolog [Acanthaster planci]XP_022107932.1 kinetochore-associated protein DSN1 homolog [Acanthaster planci]
MASSSKRKSMGKKRRSSFVRGRSRKSLPPTDVSCAELHKRIPTDIPEAKRLCQLQEACFQFTMQKLQIECPAMEGWEAFEEEATEALRDALNSLESEGILDRVCSRKNSYLPNPENDTLQETITEIQQQSERLSAESNKWEELLQLYKEEAEDAERTLASQQSEVPVLKAPDSLTNEQKKLLSGLPDLRRLSSWARQAADKLQLQAGRVHEGGQQMMQFARYAEAYLSQQTKILAKKSLQDALGDPRKLIQGAAGDASSSQ